ncbi:MAG: type VI secretion system ATPase TssH [Myxococcota bacterium]
MRVDQRSLLKLLTPTTTKAVHSAVVRAGNSEHYDVTVEHVLHELLNDDRGDVATILRHFDKNPIAFRGRVERVLEALKGGNHSKPALSTSLFNWIEDAWLYASVERGQMALRSGMLFAQIVRRPHDYTAEAWPEISDISADELNKVVEELLSTTAEAIEAAPTPSGAPSGAKGRPNQAPGGPDSALGRFATNFTQSAREGRIDPIFGRDKEIRQMIDILARRRKNNPIIVGEPGVGKSALVEGLALSIANGEVPATMKNVELMSLDLGALQAGASVKGEFENRLRAVIEEVKSSPKPIILFIDEAHTIIGAGGQKGGGDAANLLKPALARGELRTVAATTWAEFKKYFEKDAALERRFQPVKVDEPSEEDATVMLRGLRAVYEKAHGVIIRDEAVAAAVSLSNRYISGRQMPDKAVDLLDTSAARVRVERGTRPEELVALESNLAALEREQTALQRDFDDGDETLGDRLAELKSEMAALHDRAEALRSRWQEQRDALDALIDARAALATAKGEGSDEATAETTESTEETGEASEAEASAAKTEEPPPAELPPAEPPPAEPAPAEPADLEALEAKIKEAQSRFDEVCGEEPLIHADVDADSVASTVAAWTGIPVGKMKRDSVSNVLQLEDTLKSRVIGQDHAIATVSEALRIATADIRNPDSPIGVLLFVGPSGVGKTETALSLAEQLYGGERFLVTINMSEFQEKHTVSRLIGSPPGYVGYGEGGMLTEAVRQRPYSVVLLDEVEKAHLDVMNLFYQVFDKGILSDGEGRDINFRNTIIILTSNLATNQLMEIYGGDERPDPEDVVSQIRPELSAHFKPALLARMTVIPYAPIDPASMRTITGLKLNKLVKRLQEAHGISTTLTDELLDEVARRCTEAETGARNIDHILRGSLMPLVARELLEQLADEETPSELEIGLGPDGDFRLDFS